jgi:hypothetical protein
MISYIVLVNNYPGIYRQSVHIMFAAVYFEHDGDVLVVNCKDNRTVKECNQLKLTEGIVVPYKTRTLDDNGRERNEMLDYDGVITFLHKGKYSCY